MGEPAEGLGPPPGPGNEPAERLRLTRGQIGVLLATLLVVSLLAYALAPILTPFLFAFIVAYIGSPMVAIAQRRGIPRSIGATLVLLLFAAVFVALLFLLVPMLHQETTILIAQIPSAVQYVNQHVLPWVATHLGMKLQLDAAGVGDLITANMNTAEGIATRLFSSLKTGGAALITLLINIILVPVVLFYLLRDWNVLFEHLDELLPRRWRAGVDDFVREIDGVLAQFLRGQLLVMLVLAVYYSVGLWIAGLELALPVGVLTGLLVFIPYLGYGLGLVLAVLAALLQFAGWGVLIGVLIVYGVGQVVEGFFLTPRLVGERIGMHPLAVIFALLAFGQLFGFFGVLLALPVSAALVVALRRLREHYLSSPLYRNHHSR